MKALSHIGLGFVICTILLCLFAGGIEQAFGILLISIVCTAGMGLVVWIPLWWVIGALAQTMYSSITGNREDEYPPRSGSGNPNAKRPAKEQRSSADEWSLAQFMQQAKAKGMQPEKADRILQEAGWSQMEIEQARQGLSFSEHID